jgi:hypothetical protein
MKKGRTVSALVWALLLSACGASPPRGVQCVTRAALHCLTPVVCEVDRALGCEVCRCADAPFTPLGAPTPPIR